MYAENDKGPVLFISIIYSMSNNVRLIGKESNLLMSQMDVRIERIYI